MWSSAWKGRDAIEGREAKAAARHKDGFEEVGLEVRANGYFWNNDQSQCRELFVRPKPWASLDQQDIACGSEGMKVIASTMRFVLCKPIYALCS